MINLITDCHFIKSIILMHETIDATASLLFVMYSHVSLFKFNQLI